MLTLNESDDLRPTIITKSDQLNSDDLLGGSITIMTTSADRTGKIDQPLAVHYEGDGGRPYKPCLTMRKVLVFAWGDDRRAWAGRSMKLYNDQAVKFGASEVGGIRISHLSHIDREIRLPLNTGRGKKGLFVVQPLAVAKPVEFIAEHIQVLDEASTQVALKAAFALAWNASKEMPDARKRIKAAYDARLAALDE